MDSSTTPATTNTNTNTNTNVPAQQPPSNLQIFPVILSSKKSVNIAKFITPVDFAKWKKSGPIKMHRAKMEDEVEKKEGENKPHYFKKKIFIERKVKNIKNIPWRLENAGKIFEGKTESNPSQYALFELEGNQFKVTPVSDWVNFKPYKQITTLTTEQAEELMNQRNSKVEDWARKMAGLNDKKATEKEAGETKGPKKKTLEEEEEDEFRFEVAQSEDNEKFAAFGEAEPSGNSRKDSSRGGKPKVIKGEDDVDGEDDVEDEENGDEPDFFGKFDDDEEVNIAIDDDDESPAQQKGERGEVEVDEEGENSLDESGKEIKKLLKREEDDSEEDLYGSDDEDLNLDDDINVDELSMLYPRHLGGAKSEKETKEDTKDEKGSNQNSTANDKSKGKKPIKKPKKEEKEKKEDKKEEKKEEKKEKEKDEKDKKAKKPKRAADSTTSTTTTPQNKKTKVETKTPQIITTPPPTSTPSTTTNAAPNSTTNNANNTLPSTATLKPTSTSLTPARLAEGEVIRILKQGRVSIHELLAKFKPILLTNDDKAKFKDWIPKLAVAEDFPDGKYLVLKPEYR